MYAWFPLMNLSFSSRCATDSRVERSSKTTSPANKTRGRCLVAHFPSVFFASSFAFLGKSVSETRQEPGQLILMTSSIPGHRSGVASSTVVDLPIAVGSQEMTPPRVTVNYTWDSFPGKFSCFLFCTTACCRAEYLTLAMNLSTPSPFKMSITRDMKVTEWVA